VVADVAAVVTVEAAVIAEAAAAAAVLAEAVAPAAVEEEDNKKGAPVSGGTLFICPAFY
jgi:limonene-1,2-epoxide hydrolase